MYGRKYMGIERSTFLIDKNHIVIKIWRKVKVKDHVNEVEEEIKKILNKDLPQSYDRTIFSEKTEIIFQHFYDLAEQGRGFAA